VKKNGPMSISECNKSFVRSQTRGMKRETCAGVSEDGLARCGGMSSIHLTANFPKESSGRVRVGPSGI